MTLLELPGGALAVGGRVLGCSRGQMTPPFGVVHGGVGPCTGDLGPFDGVRLALLGGEDPPERRTLALLRPRHRSVVGDLDLARVVHAHPEFLPSHDWA